jgi:hypothetical protein
MSRDEEFASGLEELGYSHDDAATFGELLARIEREKGVRACQQISVLISKHFGRGGALDDAAFEEETEAALRKAMD